MSSTTPTPTPSLSALAATDMSTPLDPSTLSSILSAPPFIPLPGALNLRDLGLYPTSPIPSSLLFRSGALSSPSPSSPFLSITLILDLRSSREVLHSPTPAIPGITNLHIPSSRVPTPIDMGQFVEDGGRTAYVKMYEEVLEIYGESFRKGLEWVRDRKGPVLFHCTAGKDRTGVLAALFLALAGAPADLIAHDYALSRIGVEPARELLMHMLKMWNKEWTVDTPGMKEFSQVKGEFILGTLEMIERRWGGVDGYVRELGFSEEDIETIRRVLKGEK
ncbi:hypothetical protein P154DRAFT_23228 [Amniculicola lignicola CBS 123094]|uniref:Tyrosine specific protein phosphatases domain-containing protein n=1 Tax=Amniculicola lignicola CBS 123094 TaxID=1392246 RepID=A0A6A5WTP8_9PLEO|nr:hypothetical protein P154DRAFT_23228 [Amniculicola lignicola CBS 123094]